MFPSGWAGGWGREELMVVNSKTVAVLHRGEEFLSGLEQELSRIKVVGDCILYVNVFCDLSLLQTLISRPDWEPARLACPKFW